MVGLSAICLVDPIADRMISRARSLHDAFAGHVSDLADAVTVHLLDLHDDEIVHVPGPLIAGATDLPVVIAQGLLACLLLQMRLPCFLVIKSVLFALGC